MPSTKPTRLTCICFYLVDTDKNIEVLTAVCPALWQRQKEIANPYSYFLRKILNQINRFYLIYFSLKFYSYTRQRPLSKPTQLAILALYADVAVRQPSCESLWYSRFFRSVKFSFWMLIPDFQVWARPALFELFLPFPV